MDLKEQVLLWMANGEVGTSSKTMALRAIGMRNRDEGHPYDPDDLRRCLLLLEAIPAIRTHSEAIAAASQQWRALVDNWDELEALFLEECGSLRPKPGTTAPKTYRRMQEVLGRKNRQPGLHIETA